MREVVIVDAVRTPIGKRGGALSNEHPIDLLGAVQQALFARTGVDPSIVGQVVGGCVGQVGAQAMNVTRNAWLAAGLPLSVPAATVDTACGSSQQATTIAYGLIAAGVCDAAVACGVEIMSRVPMGSTVPQDPDVGRPVNRSYRERYDYTTQFAGAEMMAAKWGITRSDCEDLGKLSQDRAAKAWEEGRFDTQIVPIERDGAEVFDKDECFRPTTPEGLAALKPVTGPEGVHTAGTSSQIADGSAAILMMAREGAEALGLRPRVVVLDACLVGCDPVLMLEGPIPATRKILSDNCMTIGDIDLIEINEAFASVVLAWQRELSADMERVNPNGGAIALGHPLGGTGALLVTKAVHDLERTNAEHALVTMCCGGGLGTGTLLRRL